MNADDYAQQLVTLAQDDTRADDEISRLYWELIKQAHSEGISLTDDIAPRMRYHIELRPVSDDEPASDAMHWTPD
jgi:hypothetical protein